MNVCPHILLTRETNESITNYCFSLGLWDSMRYQPLIRFSGMQGLVTKARKNLDPAAAPFAKDPGGIDGLAEGANLLEVVGSIGLYLLAS